MKSLWIAILLVLAIFSASYAKDSETFQAINTLVTSTSVSYNTTNLLSEAYTMFSCDILASSATVTGQYTILYSANSWTDSTYLFNSATALVTNATKTAGRLYTITPTTSSALKPFRAVSITYSNPSATGSTLWWECVTAR